jgi:hypothetical protein
MVAIVIQDRQDEQPQALRFHDCCVDQKRDL